MDSEIDRLLDRLRDVEQEIERTVEARRAEFRYQVKKKRVVFEEHVIAQHRRLRTGLLRFLKSSPLLVVLTAPVVYALVLPLVVLDLGVCLYQLVCFPIWGITRVRRSDYVVIDRQHLAYLNAVQKVNCVYCGYTNGLIAFMQEVAGRTEQYWCPIKHARPVKAPHQRYRQFLDYGDADGFHARLDGFRDRLRQAGDRRG